MKHSKRIFLGADVGGTKTRILLADVDGHVLGAGLAGPGNPESVGYDGLSAALTTAFDSASTAAGVAAAEIDAAGFGVAGYDWDSQEGRVRDAISAIGLTCPLRAVNDTLLGVLAGCPDGWGVAVVSGTGCNCWGWNADRSRVGRVTGGGTMMGEGAGSSELVDRAITCIAHAWIRRASPTLLSDAFVTAAGAKHPADLLEGLMDGRYSMNASAAPLVFQAALRNDRAAVELIRWAGHELAEMAAAVTRQLEFQDTAFDLVMLGSMFDGSPDLENILRQELTRQSPKITIRRLTSPPVVGAVRLAMEQIGPAPDTRVRERLAVESIGRLAGLAPAVVKPDSSE